MKRFEMVILVFLLLATLLVPTTTFAKEDKNLDVDGNGIVNGHDIVRAYEEHNMNVANAIIKNIDIGTAIKQLTLFREMISLQVQILNLQIQRIEMANPEDTETIDMLTAQLRSLKQKIEAIDWALNKLEKKSKSNPKTLPEVYLSSNSLPSMLMLGSNRLMSFSSVINGGNGTFSGLTIRFDLTNGAQMPINIYLINILGEKVFPASQEGNIVVFYPNTNMVDGNYAIYNLMGTITSRPDSGPYVKTYTATITSAVFWSEDGKYMLTTHGLPLQGQTLILE